MEKFLLLTKVIGYFSKVDKTNAPEQALVSGSQNVLINDGEKVASRLGYTIQGAAGSGSDPIVFSKDWSHSTNGVISLRGYSTTLQAYFGTVDGVAINAWTNIGEGITFASAIKGAEPWWDTSEGIDLLLIINGTDKLYDWSGGVTTVKSVTANTITKNGTGTWAAARFKSTGTVYIGGNAYAYTGGTGTTTLTGVTPTPTGEAADALAYQMIKENDNEPADTFLNDFIKVSDNQVWLGSNKSNEVYVSKNTSITDYATSTPRLPGEGALLVLDSVGRGFLPQQGFMLISAGRNDWYRSEFDQLDIGGILTETLYVKKLKAGSGMAAQSQDLIDGDFFVSFEPVLRRVIGIGDNNEFLTEDLSDPIKPDFDIATFTGGHLLTNKNRVYITAPTDSNLWINEVRRNISGSRTRFWQPPQILPVRRLAIIDDLIYGHSSGFNETYKLFTGTNDNGNPIAFNASYSYRSYGDRFNYKKFDKWATEGYIRGNTKLTLQLRYDFLGAEQTLEKIIDGADEKILFEIIGGLTPGGTTPLGLQEESTQQPKFRQVSEFASRDFFEIQSIYFCSAVDDQFEIISSGGNILKSGNKPNYLTR